LYFLSCVFLPGERALMPARLVLRFLYLHEQAFYQQGNAISALPLGVFDQLTQLE